MSELRSYYEKHYWSPFTQMGDLAEKQPLMVVSGDGATVRTDTGETYIDVHGGLWLANVGYGRKEIADAVYEQMNRLSWFPSFDGMANDAAVRLAHRLVQMTQTENMNRVFFASGGSEANETALKIARQYWRLKVKKNKYKIISRNRAYHGVTMGALSATGIAGNRKHFEPLVPGFRHIEAPYCYRCPYELSRDSCELNCAKDLERTLEFEDPETVAAFIGEPVMGAGGMLVPPDGYWQQIQRICREHEVLLIVDEVVTGFGRTGEMFGTRHWDITPDMMVFAKALTSGYQPLGATMVSEEIFSAYLGKHGEGRTFLHGNTYAGHPAACAAAGANLDIIQRESLVRQAREKGRYLLDRLEKLRVIPVVGDVSALGLMGRVELVKDTATKTPFSATEGMGDRVSEELLNHNIILRPLGDTLTFSPPLVIEYEQIDMIVKALTEVLSNL